MKTMKYLIVLLIIFMCFTTPVFAEDNEMQTWDVKCDDATKDGTKQGCWETVKYCEGDEEKNYTGCFFDKNNPDYTTSRLPNVDKGDINDGDTLIYANSPNDSAAILSPGLSFRIYNNIPARKAYAAISDYENKKVSTLVCYKGYGRFTKNHYVNQFGGSVLTDRFETFAFDVVPYCNPGNSSTDPNADQDCIGPVFIFKLFEPSSKTGQCKTSMVKIVLTHQFNSEFLTKRAEKFPELFKNLRFKNRVYDGDPKNAYLLNFGNEANIALLALPESVDSLSKKPINNIYVSRMFTTSLQDVNKNPGVSISANFFNGLGVNESYLLPDLKGSSWINHSEVECPMYFNVNPNLGSDYVNKYRISNDISDNEYDKNLGTWINNVFTGNYNNGTSYKGCTTDDEVGYEEMEKCFKDAEQDILRKSCPSDLNGFNKFTEDLNKYQTKCTERYKDLYAKFLMKENSKDYNDILKKAKNTKIDDCYYKFCKITESEKKLINEELKKNENKNCKDGCKITSKYEYSDSPNAKCWGCVNGNDMYYVWTDVQTMGGLCHPETSVSKENCYGSVNDQLCINCLKNVYSKSTLSEDKIKCMSELLGIKEKIKVDTDGIVDQQSSENIDQIAQENAEAMSDTFTHYYKPGGLDGRGFGPENQECIEIVGANGSKIVKTAFDLARIVGAIIAIVNAMVTLIPAVTSKNADGLKKAAHKCVIMAVVLAAIGIFPSIVRLIASLFGYDITCLI